MNTDIKNPDKPRRDVRFIDNKLKVVELDNKGNVIRIIKDYTGPSPNNKKRHAWEKYGFVHIVKSTEENTEKNPIKLIADDTEKKVDRNHISTQTSAKREVRFVDGKLRVVEVDKIGRVVRIVKDYTKQPIVYVEDDKLQVKDERLPADKTTELIIKSTIETLSENVARGAPRFTDKPKPIIKVTTESVQEHTLEPVVEPAAEPITEPVTEEKVEPKFPELDVQELLDKDKFYDENTHFLYCPECHRFEVRFIGGQDAWICNWCTRQTNYEIFKFSDKNKYQIYKLWGVEALRDITHMRLEVAKQFIASYFKKCCETKKNECLYFGIFEEEQITDKLEMAKMVCKFIRKNIEENATVIETIKSLLGEDIRKQIDEEYAYLIQIADLMVVQLDDYLVATAGANLEKDQAVYVIVDNDKPTVDLNPVEGMECIECFTWNKADKGNIVGVSSLPSSSLDELRQMFKLFTEKLNQYINTGVLNDISKIESRIKSLSNIEKNVLFTIHSSENGYVQSQLWKKLGMSKEIGLEILEPLKDLIIKEPINYCGTYTYRLKIIELGILLLELEINSGPVTTKKNAIKKNVTKKRSYKRKTKEST